MGNVVEQVLVFVVFGSHLAHQACPVAVAAGRITGMGQIDSQPLRSMPSLGHRLISYLALQFQRLIHQRLRLVTRPLGVQTHTFGNQRSQLRLFVATPFALHLRSNLARGLDLATFDQDARQIGKIIHRPQA